jgi:adenylylsulfate kinase
MWLSPLTVTPAKAREAASVFAQVYFAGNAHVFMQKAAGTPSSAYSLAGRLVGTRSGWVILEVPMALVRGAFDALHEPGAEIPPAHSDYENYKAHISVMRPEELKDVGGAGKVTERGHYFHYTLGPVQSVTPAGWSEMSKVWFIKVKSPELQKLRRTYGLSSKPNDDEFDFHITIGVRRKSVLQANDVSKAAADLVPPAFDPEVIIDRPKGFKKTFQTSAGPKELTYPLDYGYFKGVINPQDREDADVFMGTGGPHHGRFMKGNMTTGTWQPDEHKWYHGLNDEELKSLQDWWGTAHDKDLIRDWTPFQDRSALLADLQGLQPSAAKTADDLAVSSISLTPDATDEAPKALPETTHFHAQERKPIQESEEVAPVVKQALAMARELNEKRAATRVPLPVIGHYEAKSKVDRSAFLYQGPHGPQEKYGQCSTCHDFTGKSCENFPKGNTVSPGGACGLYHFGKGSDELLGKEMGSFTKAEAGYVDREVRCENCAYFDDDESYCELFEKLNEQFPSVFDMDKKVDKYGCCNAQTQRGHHAEKEETQEAKTKTVAIDLDGTLAEYDGWRGADVIGDPRPGAVEVVRWLKARGTKVILWTTRGNTERLKQWLKQHDIPVDYINENPTQPPDGSKKIIAEIYVDDRVIDARKSWPEIKKELAERLEK